MAASDLRRHRPSSGTGKTRGGPRTATVRSQHHDDSHALDDVEVTTNAPAQLPQDDRAERGLIDSAIQDQSVLLTFGKVKPQYFFRHAHQVIWQTMLEMHAAEHAIDHITLVDALRTAGRLDDAGGDLAIYELGSRVTHPHFAAEYARIICEKYLARFILRGTGSLAAVAARGDVREIASASALQHLETQEVLSALGLSSNGEEGPRFRLKTMDEVLAEPDPEWILPGYLEERRLWLLYGDSNTGKSFLALDMGLSFATGLPWHGHPVQSGSVVYVVAEGASGMRKRIRAWLAVHRMAGSPIPNFHLIDEPPNLLDPAEVSGLIAQINTTLDEPPVMVVFDTLAACMPGADENSSEGMGAALAALRQVQRECQSGVLVIHHSGKDSARGPRGHSSLRAAFDAALEVSASEETGIVTLRGQKARDEDKRNQQIGFRLKRIALDEYARVTSCVPEALDEPPPPDPRTVRRKPTAADKLYALMAQSPTPLTHGELRRRFVEETGMTRSAFDKALDQLDHERRIDNIQGGWRALPENSARSPV